MILHSPWLSSWLFGSDFSACWVHSSFSAWSLNIAVTQDSALFWNMIPLGSLICSPGFCHILYAMCYVTFCMLPDRYVRYRYFSLSELQTSTMQNLSKSLWNFSTWISSKHLKCHGSKTEPIDYFGSLITAYGHIKIHWLKRTVGITSPDSVDWLGNSGICTCVFWCSCFQMSAGAVWKPHWAGSPRWLTPMAGSRGCVLAGAQLWLQTRAFHVAWASQSTTAVSEEKYPKREHSKRPTQKL